MNPDTRENLMKDWQRAEDQRRGVEDLRTGGADPAERERALDDEQDRIEYELGVAEMERRRRDAGDDGD